MYHLLKYITAIGSVAFLICVAYPPLRNNELVLGLGILIHPISFRSKAAISAVAAFDPLRTIGLQTRMAGRDHGIDHPPVERRESSRSNTAGCSG